MKLKNRIGFNLIELMVVIAIIAILASVAMPMYSQFKRRSKAASAIKAVSQASQALQSWHENLETFSGMQLGADNRTILANGGNTRVGTSLGAVQGVTFSITSADANRVIVDITWSITAGCGNCDGQFCVECNADICNISVLMDAPDPHGLSRNSDPSNNACS